jgi:hypothetical protein
MLRFAPDIEGIYGDFEVCPFTPERKGHMQMVCVQSAKKLIGKAMAEPASFHEPARLKG